MVEWRHSLESPNTLYYARKMCENETETAVSENQLKGIGPDARKRVARADFI